MKKYFMYSMTLLAVCIMAVSCSNDSVYDGSRSKVVDDYNQAFLKYVGGHIAGNQDWGFGSTTRGANVVPETRAFTSSYPFPSAPDDDEYATVKPEEAVLITGYQSGNLFYIDETVSNNGQTIQPAVAWDATNKHIDLYVEGNVTLSGIYLPGNTTLYLLPGSKLTMPAGDYNFEQALDVMYIASGAELVVSGKLGIGDQSKIFNHGTITANQVQVRNTGLFYNQGTLDMSQKSNGEISVENASSVIVNDGTIRAKAFPVRGGGHVQNNGEFYVSGNTDLDSKNNTWVNNNYYETNNITCIAGSSDIINNCQLVVNNLFHINLGSTLTNGFRVDEDGSVITKDLLIDSNAFIFLSNRALFRVTGTASLGISNPNYGIYGPADGDYAVFEAKTVEKIHTNQRYEITYGNNLAVVAQSHFAQGHDGAGLAEAPYIGYVGNATLYTDGDKPAFSIAKSECSPGFTGSTASGTTADIRIIAEDLSASEESDFDFNDVVFDVKFTADDKATVTLRAAGGTLPLKIGSTNGVGGVEVHQAFGVTTKTMVNTHASRYATNGYAYADDLTADPFEVTGIDKTKNGKDIRIEVEKDGQWYEITAEEGEPAAKLGVDPKFKWVDEKVSLKSVYKAFEGWVSNPSVVWY